MSHDNRTLMKLAAASLAFASASMAVSLETTGWYHGAQANIGTYFDTNKGPLWAATTTWPTNDFFFNSPQPTSLATGFGQSTPVLPIEADWGYWATYLVNVNGMVLGCGSDANYQLGGLYPNGTTTPKIIGLTSPLTDVIQVESSGLKAGRMNYALTARGRVFRWGWDGNANHPVTEIAAQSGPFDKVKQIACDASNVFMLRSNGEVWVYGQPGYAGYAIGTANPNFPAALLDASGSPVKNIKSIAAGSNHLVLLDAKGNVFGLGRTDSGQFGGPSLSGSLQQKTPVPILGPGSVPLDRVKEITCTTIASFFVRADGTVWGVGDGNKNLQCVAPASLADTSANNWKYRKVAAQIPNLSNIKKIWGGEHTAYALDAGGNAFAWGVPDAGARGFVNHTGLIPNPISLTGYANYQAQAVLSGSSNMLIKSNGNAYKWGANPPTGIATPATQNVPAILMWGPQKPHTYVPDTYMTSAITHDGKLMTAGQADLNPNANSGIGQPIYALGQGVQSPGVKPFGNTNIPNVIDVDTQWGSTLALLGNGQLVGFGVNPLGASTVVNVPSPISIPLDPAMATVGIIDVDIAMGRMYHNLDATLIALTADGRVWTFGSDLGALRGDGGSTPPANQWTRVKDANGIDIQNVIAIDGGHAHALALCADGTVWAWGTNWHGQVGDGQAVTQANFAATSAVKSSISGVKAIAAGAMMPGTWVNSSGFTLYLTDNGDVFSCGSNRHMALGWGNPAGDMLPHPTPTKVQGLTEPIKEIRAGWSVSAALSSRGHVRVWGQNLAGQFGNGSTSAGSTTPIAPNTNELFWKLCLGSVSQTAIGITAK